jgi:hypothetical protein
MKNKTKQQILEELRIFREKELAGEIDLNFANESKGLGDTIAKVTHAFGIKPCSGCKKRQKWLNEKFPYKEKDTLDSEDIDE